MRRINLLRVVVLSLGLLLFGRVAAAQSTQFKFDGKFGPAIGIIDETGSQFHLGFHFGINFTPTQTYHIYLDLPLAFNFGNGHTDIMILPGVEADIALPVGAPLYIYPMFGMGPAFFLPTCPAPLHCDSQTQFGFHLGAGVKYVLDGRWNFFFEPLNIEFYPIGNAFGTLGHYNLLFGAGVNF
jgi:hypothetical protein